MAGSARMTFTGNIRSNPEWAGDFGGREHIAAFPAKIDPAQFTDGAGVNVTLVDGGTNSYAANALILKCAALTLPINDASTIITSTQGLVLIPAGTVLDFGGLKFARLTADAKLGDVYLSVAAIPTAVVAGDTTVFSKFGTEFIASGTLVGRTFAERDAGTSFGPAATTDDEIYLTYFDVPNAKVSDDVELYRHYSLVKENYLPSYTTLSTGVNEVQTLNFTNTPAGTFRLRIKDSNGVYQYTQRITYSATIATLLANLQTATDAVLAANAIVWSGSLVTAVAGTFSGAGYTGKAQEVIVVDTDALTAGDVDVTRTTAGGTPLLTKIRELYQCIKGAG